MYIISTHVTRILRHMEYYNGITSIPVHHLCNGYVSCMQHFDQTWPWQTTGLAYHGLNCGYVYSLALE